MIWAVTSERRSHNFSRTARPGLSHLITTEKLSQVTPLPTPSFGVALAWLELIQMELSEPD